MASVIVASITAVPLVLLIWDLTRTKERTADQYAGPARVPARSTPA
ncbi:MAG: hypothetical protein JWM73_1244 [Solirubrobacterales bacterium]|nr:hypothetical protein [Solirubrobacterales bacterium]